MYTYLNTVNSWIDIMNLHHAFVIFKFKQTILQHMDQYVCDLFFDSRPNQLTKFQTWINANGLRIHPVSGFRTP